MLRKLAHNVTADLDSGSVTRFTEGISNIYEEVQALYRGLRKIVIDSPEDKLDFARPHHALANLRRAFRLAVRPAQLFVIHRRNVNVNIDAVHQRPGNLGHITLDHRLTSTDTLSVPTHGSRTGTDSWPQPA